MDMYWRLLVEPALAAMKPRKIVEIGSEDGNNTRNLLEFCRQNDAVLHVVDPLPRFDVPLWQQIYGHRFVLHRGLSLDALPSILTDGAPTDIALVDGDHNWYTVINELRLIERGSSVFPLVLLHDLGWPYGRRDLYYNPDTIPPEFRQSYAARGMCPGVSELLDDGFNRTFFNALHENTPRNGVLTAVEDFLRECPQPLRFLQVPGFFGLGLLFRPQLADENPAFAAFLRVWDLPEPVRHYLQMLESQRVQLLTNSTAMWEMLQRLGVQPSQ